MAEPGALDYFYGTEAEQYTFYRIPKVLFTDPGFRRITADAKILYGLMLDRMGLGLVFQNPLPSFHPFDLLVGAVAAVLLRLVVWSKIKNAKKYRHGEEYGTARWSA